MTSPYIIGDKSLISRSLLCNISGFPFVFCLLSLMPFMPWLSWDLHCKPGWPQANREPLASASESWGSSCVLLCQVPPRTSKLTDRVGKNSAGDWWCTEIV